MSGAARDEDAARMLLRHPGIPRGDAAEFDPERRIDADTLPPEDVVARIDVSYAVMVTPQQSA